MRLQSILQPPHATDYPKLNPSVQLEPKLCACPNLQASLANSCKSSTHYNLNRSSEEWQRVIKDIGQDEENSAEDEERDEDNMSDGSSEAE